MIIERRIAYSFPRGSLNYWEIRGEDTRSLLVGRIIFVGAGTRRAYYIVEGHDFTAEPEGRTRYRALYLGTVQDDRAAAEKILVDHLSGNGATPVAFGRS